MTLTPPDMGPILLSSFSANFGVSLPVIALVLFLVVIVVIYVGLLLGKERKGRGRR